MASDGEFGVGAGEVLEEEGDETFHALGDGDRVEVETHVAIEEGECAAAQVEEGFDERQTDSIVQEVVYLWQSKSE